jgi:hypothetical protein
VTKLHLDIAPSQTSFVTFFSQDGLTLSEECDSAYDIGIDFQVVDGDSLVTMSGFNTNGDPTPTLEDFAGFDPSTDEEPGGFVDESPGTTAEPLFHTNPGSNEGAGVLTYSNTAGQSVSVSLGWDYDGAFDDGHDCGVWGTATASS